MVILLLSGCLIVWSSDHLLSSYLIWSSECLIVRSYDYLVNGSCSCLVILVSDNLSNHLVVRLSHCLTLLSGHLVVLSPCPLVIWARILETKIALCTRPILVSRIRALVSLYSLAILISAHCVSKSAQFLCT